MESGEFVAHLSDLEAVTVNDIVAVVRDGMDFEIPNLRNNEVVHSLKTDVDSEGRTELIDALRDPSLTPEQRRNITSLKLALGKITSSARTRVEFEQVFSQDETVNLQTTLFDAA